MAKNKKIIKIVKGKETDILLIAPHGVNVPGVKNDDKRTDILTYEIAEKLECSALVNDRIKRTACNYNSMNAILKRAYLIAKEERNSKGMLEISRELGLSFIMLKHYDSALLQLQKKGSANLL